MFSFSKTGLILHLSIFRDSDRQSHTYNSVVSITVRQFLLCLTVFVCLNIFVRLYSNIYKTMKKIIYLVILAFTYCSYAQTNLNQKVNQTRIEQNIKAYILNLNPDYLPISFGEGFIATNKREIAAELKRKFQNRFDSTLNIKYSVLHTYKIGESSTFNDYFYLDYNYKVKGYISFETVGNIFFNQLMNVDLTKIDSVIKSNWLKNPDKYKYDKQFNSGIIEFKQNMYQKASQYFTNAININSSQALAFYYRGLCYKALKNKSMACFDFQMAFELKCIETDLKRLLKDCE